MNARSPSSEVPKATPSALSVSSNPLNWLRVFGPGAVIASLTIGSGELIFSSRGGSIFGYRLLWFFLLVLVLKWILLYSAARHMVLTGAHPFERWAELGGPRGWLPAVLLLLALVAFPIWVCFHAGTIGTLLSWLAGTERTFNGQAHDLWGMAVLMAVLALSLRGGYAALERIQLVLVVTMLAAVIVSLFLLQPDWIALVKGLVPQALSYPSWIAGHAEIARRPVWVETVTYVGVVGGSAYDYLAYVSYLRDKRWGQAGGPLASPALLDKLAAGGAARNPWLRVLLLDCTLSFAAVLVFSGVFVACGAIILAPQHKIPSGTNLLDLQAEFVAIYPWLKPLYFLGALLALAGTLYGTVEVAPAVLREAVAGFHPGYARSSAATLRRWAVWWTGCGGLMILAFTFGWGQVSGGEAVPGLVPMLTPANLFTGVLACGLVCLLNPWMDRRFLPPPLRMPPLLRWLNLLAGAAFVALGVKACWDHSGWTAFVLLAGTLLLGLSAAGFLRRLLDKVSRA